MDVYAQDMNGTVYDAEMQRRGITTTEETEKDELAIRSRYYQGIIDLNLLERGDIFLDLKECYVLFICTFDPFGEGKYRYTFKNRCIHGTDLVLKDRTTKIFYNTRGDMTDAPEELHNFLEYIETKRIGDDFIKYLDGEVDKARNNDRWRREYMKEIIYYQEMKRDAINEGKAIGIELGKKKEEKKEEPKACQ